MADTEGARDRHRRVRRVLAFAMLMAVACAAVWFVGFRATSSVENYMCAGVGLQGPRTGPNSSPREAMDAYLAGQGIAPNEWRQGGRNGRGAYVFRPVRPGTGVRFSIVEVEEIENGYQAVGGC